MEIQFIKYRKVYFLFSGILLFASLLMLIIFKLNLGIEFTGGTLIELKFISKVPSSQELQKILKESKISNPILQYNSKEKTVSIKFQSFQEQTQKDFLNKLRDRGFQFDLLRLEQIGPIIGKELREKALILIFLSLIAILIYVALTFRDLKWPFKSWVYGALTVIALAHDILITLGFLSFVGYKFSIQFTIPILVAILTIAGYSVNDTVVILDRIRENLTKTSKALPFPELVNSSLNQVLGRSISTTFTTQLVLLSLLFYGAKSLFNFSLVLIFGILVGTYSSLFFVGPILTEIYLRKTQS